MRWMRQRRWRAGLVSALVILALLVSAASLLALATNGYQLAWWSVDGGGGRSQGGGYQVAGTAGQPDAGLLTGPGYSLGGGLWGGGALAPAGQAVYLPLVNR